MVGEKSLGAGRGAERGLGEAGDLEWIMQGTGAVKGSELRNNVIRCRS